jgi:hypothetical protein
MEAHAMSLGKVVIVVLALIVVFWMLGGFLRNYRDR